MNSATAFLAQVSSTMALPSAAAAMSAATAALLRARGRPRASLCKRATAHLLSPAQLEEIRLLTNGEMDSVNPFARTYLLGHRDLLACRRVLRHGQPAPPYDGQGCCVTPLGPLGPTKTGRVIS